jgi:hypothetical protein
LRLLYLLLLTLSICFVSIDKVGAQTVSPGPARCIAGEVMNPSGGIGAATFTATNRCPYQISAFICVESSPGTCTSTNIGSVENLNSQGDVNSSIVFNLGSESIEGFIDECPPDAFAGGSTCTVGGSPIVSAVLPSAATFQIGSVEATPTVFATVENIESTPQEDCVVTVIGQGPSGFSFTFQTTNPFTNEPVGSPNTAFPLPGNSSQTLVLSFKSTVAFSEQIFPVFSCQTTLANVSNTPASVTAGINTVALTFSTNPIANIVAEAQTPSNNGTLSITLATDTEGAFAIATSNSGASASITATPSVVPANLPASVLICQTNPSTGACLASPAASVTTQINVDATPTFSVFVDASEAIPLSTTASLIERVRGSADRCGAAWASW